MALPRHRSELCTRVEPCWCSFSSIYPGIPFVGWFGGMAARSGSGASPAGINTSAWCSPNSPTAKACGTSKPVWAPSRRSSTTSAFAPERFARSTLADANEKRDWRIYADFAQVLIDQARRLYSGDSFVVELELTVYALDSTTIDVCLSLFPGLLPEPGSIYVLDRGYTDFARLQLLALPGDFVIRARRDFRFDRRCSRSVDG